MKIFSCPPEPLPSARELSFNENGLVLLKIFLDGASAANGVGYPDGVGLGQFVVHQPFANEAHLEIQSRHSPDLTGFQGLPMIPAHGLGFAHFRVCTETPFETS
jgi:hypothetical protein